MSKFQGLEQCSARGDVHKAETFQEWMEGSLSLSADEEFLGTPLCYALYGLGHLFNVLGNPILGQVMPIPGQLNLLPFKEYGSKHGDCGSLGLTIFPRTYCTYIRMLSDVRTSLAY